MQKYSLVQSSRLKSKDVDFLCTQSRWIIGGFRLTVVEYSMGGGGGGCVSWLGTSELHW
jgi:hypothetical protein